MLLDGPIGQVTFTALSNKLINIQVDNGTSMGPYTGFTVQRESVSVCKITAANILNDCSDQSAKLGANDYQITADYTGGSSAPKSFTTKTLERERTLFS